MITTINEFKIFESFSGKVKVRDRTQLKTLIDANIKHFGNMCDLNYLDVSAITDMSSLFYQIDFNGNISEWNVSNVVDMGEMFNHNTVFNGDISKWDVSKVTDMNRMFQGCPFNGDISNWDVSNVIDMNSMFADSNFNQDISGWNVSNVVDMKWMFWESKFNQDISNWNVSKVYAGNMEGMFKKSALNKNNKIPTWYRGQL